MIAHWQCRLYGHDWHHPWNHEVVVTADDGPVYPLRCVRCADVRLLDREGTSWHPDDENGPSIHEQALETDSSASPRRE
ncbi:hypothetical protein [Halobiforma nitratireducens]|uniref:Uncharacterized protein n=1 Tax=Halobiforma nitratireducens JCM 10879 TaxID=1227454 RepID=M0LUW4_9EURY|nr:hypothetical protein [Halobiforma nitratireducens]EMA37362.1 hypothetical protein C446_10925 [Halobiforma nitratireducens JCM 10879]